ncbi:L,D-transpeptidase [Variovorax sp. IB41]|uniref:L,D-transpeptidase n=1 Tax=Variovorax sp. IB41 TaxID=2779370 RepID=UPI0018E80DF1|nr:L,D-transpeptidase [Variovorax sp. IB41]MBJ2154341.1 L,D-transpeptidase [Variovorax sp. IB41]
MSLPSPRTGIAGRGLAVLAACTLAAACTAAAATEPDALRFAKAAVAAADNQGQAFAVIDKKKARVFVFDAQGRLRGDSPVLLGLAHGDDSVPGIGERKMADIRPDERTTPAGRFRSEPGRNLQGEDIVWVDYDAAVSMHRVRATNKAERRLERLATPSVADNRISYGCINVPAGFYDTHIRPVLGERKGVVYVLPESTPLQARFGFMGPG